MLGDLERVVPESERTVESVSARCGGKLRVLAHFLPYGEGGPQEPHISGPCGICGLLWLFTFWIMADQRNVWLVQGKGWTESGLVTVRMIYYRV